MGTQSQPQPDKHIPLLKKYPSALMHLHQQRLLRRLCCIFGAGASANVGMADWSDFISELAAGLTDLDAVDRSKRDLIARAQELFYAFGLQYDTRMAAEGTPRPTLADPGLHAYEARLIRDWRDRVYDTLYKSKDSIAKRVEGGDGTTYYQRFAPIIRLLPVTITFNFDDWLERTLAVTRQPRENQETQRIHNGVG